MRVNILDYGAVADGRTLSTAAIQAAVDECAAGGGGTVVVPQGIFYTGTIRLRSNIELRLEHGSVLKASESLEDYNELDEYEQNFSVPETEEWVGKHLILAVECDNAAITGTGTIDGSGDSFYGEPRYWENFSSFWWRDGLRMAKSPEELRPGQVVTFVECTDVRIKDISIKNAPCWCCFLHGCDKVIIDGIKIHNASNHGNTDGIDIDSSSHVTISNCVIDTGDDCITFRGGEQLLKNKRSCEYITVTNCVLASSSSVFRVGVGVGTIRHIRVSNVVIERAAICVQFQSSYTANGCCNIEDVHFSKISAVGAAFPIMIGCDSGAYMRNITVEDMRVEGFAGMKIGAAPNHDCSDVKIRNIDYTVLKNPAPLSEGDMKVRGESVISVQNIRGLVMENVSIHASEEVCALWEDYIRIKRCPGAKINNILLP